MTDILMANGLHNYFDLPAIRRHATAPSLHHDFLSKHPGFIYLTIPETAHVPLPGAPPDLEVFYRQREPTG